MLIDGTTKQNKFKHFLFLNLDTDVSFLLLNF